MKKIVKILLAVCMAITAIVPLTGCADEWVGEQVDGDRKQIYVGLYEGGWGRDWLDEAKAEFEKIYPEYQIMISSQKDEYRYDQLVNNIANDYIDVYITECSYNVYTDKKFLLDITDAVTGAMPEAFNDSKTIESKIDDQHKNFYNRNGKYYAVPFGSSIWGLNYDVDLFEEKQLYMGKNGGFVGVNPVTGEWTGERTLGRDGVANTYDDGTPVTWDEFKSLLAEMRRKSVMPFIFSDISGYRKNIWSSMIADYLGKDKFRELIVNLSGDATYNGSTEHVTPEKGYLAAMTDAKAATVTFAKEIVDGKYYDSRSGNGNISFTRAQDYYLESKLAASTDVDRQRIAFILDGGHWYNESKAYNQELVNNNYPEYRQRGRRFSVMPFPKAAGHSSDKASYLESSYEFAMFANANSDQPEGAKKFIQFLNCDSMLKVSTIRSGICRTARCELTDAEKAEMPYYYRVINEIATSDKTEIVSPLTTLPYFTEHPERRKLEDWLFFGAHGGKEVDEPIRTFMNNPSLTVDDCMQATKEYYSVEGRW